MMTSRAAALERDLGLLRMLRGNGGGVPARLHANSTPVERERAIASELFSGKPPACPAWRRGGSQRERARAKPFR